MFRTTYFVKFKGIKDGIETSHWNVFQPKMFIRLPIALEHYVQELYKKGFRHLDLIEIKKI